MIKIGLGFINSEFSFDIVRRAGKLILWSFFFGERAEVQTENHPLRDNFSGYKLWLYKGEPQRLELSQAILKVFPEFSFDTLQARCEKSIIFLMFSFFGSRKKMRRRRRVSSLMMSKGLNSYFIDVTWLSYLTQIHRLLSTDFPRGALNIHFNYHLCPFQYDLFFLYGLERKNFEGWKTGGVEITFWLLFLVIEKAAFHELWLWLARREHS